MGAPFDSIFGLSAVAFNLLISVVLAAWRVGKPTLARKLGAGLVALGLPFGAVLYHTLTAGRSLYVRVALAAVLAYILTELLLDFILKYDFRARFITHFPYILLEYAAFVGLIYVAFTISDPWGWAVSITFWLAMGALIYYLTGNKKPAQKMKKKKR